MTKRGIQLTRSTLQHTTGNIMKEWFEIHDTKIKLELFLIKNGSSAVHKHGNSEKIIEIWTEKAPDFLTSPTSVSLFLLCS